MKKLTIEYLRKNGMIAYEYIRGSHAYGTNIKDENGNDISDTDIGGVYICSEDTLFGLRGNYVEQVNDEKHDTVFYEFGRWIELLMKSNPTALESLFIPKDCIIGKVHPAVQHILDNKEKFLTKECLSPLLGYSFEQIKKAKGLNKKINIPENFQRREVLDFCYTFKNQGSQPIKDFLVQHNLDQRYCGLVNIPNMKDTFGVYYDFAAYYKFENEHISWNSNWETMFNIDYPSIIERIEKKEFFHYKGIVHPNVTVTNEDGSTTTLYNYGVEDGDETGKERESNSVRLSSIPKGEVPICFMTYNKDAYESHCTDYKNWVKWKKERNPVRYENNKGHNYDCYLDSETEFLTDKGWKKYDNVLDTDLIACFNKNHEIMWSPIISRFSDIYNGEIYTHESTYTRFSVTPNHKLYLSPAHRTKYNNFSTKYNEKKSDWKLITVNDYFNGNRSFFHYLGAINNPNQDNLKYSDDFIKLLGGFLSEGNFLYKNDKIKEIRISQIEGNRLCDTIRSIKDFNVKEYHYNKRGKGDEITWVCNDNFVIDEIKKCNGRYSFEKTIPEYVYSFSKRQFDLLFETMIKGDGTIHKKNKRITYYTSSKNMAIELNTLLTINGYRSQLYGGENGFLNNCPTNFKRKDGNITGMFQVSVSSKKKNIYDTITKTKNRKRSGWKIKTVKNEKIVCFETITGTLITKNKNKFAFHGNSKNLMHTIRLMEMGVELAEGKGFNVRRTGDDVKHLLAIRNHEYSYEEIIKEATELKERFDKLAETTKLPDKIDYDYMNHLLIESRKMAYNRS